MVNPSLSLETAKTALYNALAHYQGDTQNKPVKEAIKKLCALNPTIAPAKQSYLLENQWLLISAPNFPQGKQLENGKWSYTLGRLAFNLFNPLDLHLVIDRVFQPIVAIGKEGYLTYDIVIEFTTIDKRYPILSGVVYNQGMCYPKNDNTLEVKFKGGILKPSRSTRLEDWEAIFGHSSHKTPKNWLQQFQNSAVRLLFGLESSEETNAQSRELTFTMKRSPKGSLEILYLDEQLRITRGNRGSIVVCEKQ